MTIAALVRGRQGNYNALFVDTGALRSDGAIEDHDKLHRVFGETYVTCVGDASLIALLRNLVKKSKSRLNLRKSGVIAGLFSELELARRDGALLGFPSAFPPPPPATTLVICNRNEAYFWKAECDTKSGAHTVPQAPTFLDAESMIVFRGVTVATIDGFQTVDAAAAEQIAVDMMIETNRQLEQGGADKLPYTMKRRVSGIVLPHKPSDAATRIDPGVRPWQVLGLSEP